MAYLGEYPLAFAACFENKDIYDLLVPIEFIYMSSQSI